MTHLPVCLKHLSENIEEKDRGPALIIYYLMPRFTHDDLTAAMEQDAANYTNNTNTRNLIKKTFFRIMGGGGFFPEKGISDDTSSAGKARLLLIYAGGPHRIKHGTHGELCKKYHISTPTFSRELRKLRELLHDYRIPHDWNPLFWTPTFKPPQRTSSRFKEPPRAPRRDSS